MTEPDLTPSEPRRAAPGFLRVAVVIVALCIAVAAPTVAFVDGDSAEPAPTEASPGTDDQGRDAPATDPALDPGVDPALDPDAEPGAEEPDTPPEPIVREIVFPIDGQAAFWNDWHQPRDGGARLHLGTDIAAPKLMAVLATVDGVVARIGPDSSGTAGNYVVIVDAEGWEYAYLHLNNDSPGTDDNANRRTLALGPGIEPGARVAAGQVIGFVGDSGNAESTVPHLHFEIRAPGRVHINPFHSLEAAWSTDVDRLCRREDLDVGAVDLDLVRATPTRRPHLVVASNGTVIALDGAAHHGDLGGAPLDGPIVAAAATRGGGGYWLLGSDGGVFAFGDAAFHGSIRSHLEQFARPGDLDAFVIEQDALLLDGDAEAVDIVAAPDDSGYWILMANGETVEFGAVAPFPRPPVPLEAPATSLVLAREGAWIVATDGGVFALQGAPYHGSLGTSAEPDDAHEHDQPAIVDLVSNRDGSGYTLFDATGAAFDFGERVTTASHATTPRCEPGTVTAVLGVDDATHRVLTDGGMVRTYGPGSDPLDDRRVHGAVDLLVGPPVIGGLG